MMKISIIGAGNAGCFTALQLADYAKDAGLDLVIEIIYNPEISPQRVGQATFPHHSFLLWNSLPNEFNWEKNQVDATLKTGINYEGWGKVNKQFFHPFPAHQAGMHFYPPSLQSFVLNSGIFDIKAGDVKDYSEVDADFIFDCRGRPKDLLEDSYTPLVNPINTCLLCKPKWDTSGNPFTRAVATQDGWSFILPSKPNSPSSQGSLGYLYNRSITGKSDAIQNLKNRFDVYTTDYIEFDNYIAKEPIIDERVFLNGNRLYFLEPLEATAIFIYTEWVVKCCGAILSYDKKPCIERLKTEIHQLIHQVERFILWHYQSGSQYDSKFWDYASKLEIEKPDPKFDELIKSLNQTSLIGVKHSEQSGRFPGGNYGVWAPTSGKYWLEGIGAES